MKWIRRIFCHPKDSIVSADESKDEQKKSGNVSNVLMVIFACLTMVFTGVVANYTCKLARYTSDLATFTRNLAVLDSEQVAIYKEATHVETRAYVVLKDMSNPTGMGVGETVRFSAHIVNVGRTPAYRVFYNSWVNICEERSLSAMESFSLDSSSRETIGANMSRVLSLTKPYVMTQERLDRIYGGHENMYFFATVRYEDVFGQHHYTNICSRYDALSPCPGWTAATKHNDAN